MLSTKLLKVFFILLRFILVFLVSVFIYTHLFSIFSIDEKSEKHSLYCDKDAIYAMLDNDGLCIKNPYLVMLGRPPLAKEVSPLKTTSQAILPKKICACLKKKTRLFSQKKDEPEFLNVIQIDNKQYSLSNWVCLPSSTIC